MLSGDKINDYDVYMRTREATLAVCKHYVDLFNLENRLPTQGVVKNRTPIVKEIKRTNIKGVTEDRVLIWMQSAGVAAAGEDKPYEYFENRKNNEDAEDFIAHLSDDPAMDPVEVAEDMTISGNPSVAGYTPSPALYKRKDFIPVFFSENAITLTNRMQIVIRFYGEPNEIHENYDFAHAMCYYDLKTNTLHTPQDALECIMSKTLIYKGSLYPIASLLRIRKFIVRGWRITAGQMLKIIFQLQGVDLKNFDILREQLIGVDQAYMHELLRHLENDDPAVQKIDSTYIANLIDKIFE